MRVKAFEKRTLEETERQSTLGSKRALPVGCTNALAPRGVALRTRRKWERTTADRQRPMELRSVRFQRIDVVTLLPQKRRCAQALGIFASRPDG